MPKIVWSLHHHKFVLHRRVEDLTYQSENDKYSVGQRELEKEKKLCKKKKKLFLVHGIMLYKIFLALLKHKTHVKQPKVKKKRAPGNNDFNNK